MAHLKNHASEHSNGGEDTITIENLACATTSVASRLRPKGDGGVEFATAMDTYFQEDEPVLAEAGDMAIWIDQNDSDRVYFIFKRGTGDQVKVELT